MDRYGLTKLNQMRVAVAALEALSADGTLFHFLRGKVLFLKDEIAREEALMREEERELEAKAVAARKAAEEAAELERIAAEQGAMVPEVAEPEPSDETADPTLETPPVSLSDD